MGTLDAITPDQDDGSWQEASTVGDEAARSAWAESARGVLIEPARSYGATVTTKQLSATGADEDAIRTQQLTHYWIGDVLARVARDCAEREEPMLSALCVNADGSVGDGYAPIVKELTGAKVGDPRRPRRQRAARLLSPLRRGDARRRWSPPADRPARRLADPRAQGGERRPTRRRLSVCNMALPATGVCDNCG